MRPYEVIAPWYAELMFHVDYEAWAVLIGKLLKRHKAKPTALLELGCGDGRLARALKLPTVTHRLHTDISLPMLRAFPPETPYFRAVCDMRQIAVRTGSVDLVLLLYDAFNYLMKPEDRAAFFSEAFRVISPGGHLLWDIATEHACTEWFDGTVDYLEFPEGEMVRLSDYDRETAVQTNRFVCYLRDGAGKRYRVRETHRQRIVAREVVEEELKRAGFELLSATHEYTTRPAREKSLRIHFLARRP